MATLLRRKCVFSALKQLTKPKQFGDFSQRKFQCSLQVRCLRTTVGVSTRAHSSQQSWRWRCLHTTNTLQKIVAFNLSDIGEGIREVVVKEWFVKVGDKVEQFDNICEVQSDKAAVTITSRYDGVITKLYGAVDETLLVGNPLVDIDVGDGDSVDAQSESASNVDSSSSSSDEEPETKVPVSGRSKVLTTPAVRRIAAQYKLDLQTVKATGRNGRVLKDDVLLHLNLTSDQSNIISESSAVQAQALNVDTSILQAAILPVGEDKVVPVSGFTKAMVKTMTESLKIPHFVLSDEYDVTELVKLRTELKDLAATRGVRLTYLPFIVKATSLALLQFPVLNSSLDSTCEHIIYKAAHNIGVAMDTPNGLVVPVIKNIQQRSILQIGAELNRLQELGSKGKLTFSDVSGGTFSLSNIGIVGGTYTKPVILAPQVSIGALGKIQVLPRFDSEGAVRAAHIVNVSWSADHRVVDGVTMAKFSNALRQYLERPNTLLIDM